MTGTFDSFVILAGMRTGSNFLEANLARLDGVRCHGEAFNPHFIGHPGQASLAGLSQADREADPFALLTRLRGAPGRPGGFRYFHDHDPRIFGALLADPCCAKIVLTRNPVDSYVSWKIAQATGQWKLTDPSRRRTARARFDAAEFDAHVAAGTAFQARIRSALQAAGQTAFVLRFDDLARLEVLNGLAAWLGVADRLDSLETGMQRQNPEPLSTKVSNYAEMAAALARSERFDPLRAADPPGQPGPAVPGYVAAARAPLLYMPVPGGPHAVVRAWLAALDDGGAGAPHDGFTQRTLKLWLRANPGHGRFTVLRHPLERAHAVFRATVPGLRETGGDGGGADPALRRALAATLGRPLPPPGRDFPDAATYRAAFKAFLKTVRDAAAGRSALPLDPRWAPQCHALRGMAALAPPDMLIREADMARDLPALAARHGRADAPRPQRDDAGARALATIHDAEIEAAARAIYGRDYDLLGFSDWAGPVDPPPDQAALTRSASVRIV